ncbi:hypothetical protein LTR86_004231 [Recurvomyces mirabilis]|nr:hypothetical protein LTR86_004231 [Recurvomyces mirabilis]
MATTTETSQIELSTLSPPQNSINNNNKPSFSRAEADDTIILTAQSSQHPDNDSTIATPAPDGGYGWVIVASCSLITFSFTGFTGCWGILQAHLLETSMKEVQPSTIVFVGSLASSACVAVGLISVRLNRLLGARTGAMIGIILLGLAQIFSGFATSNIGALFAASGAISGLGMSFLYTICNSIPTQYFTTKLGTANGLIKLGGGIGATVLALASEAMIQSVGIAWTFRIIGFMTLATGLPAAALLRDRTKPRNVPFVELSMFRNLAYTCVFIGAALSTFTLFVPPFFLPLMARSVGLSSGVGAGLVAGYNACNAFGRFASGPTCDRIGANNTFVIGTLISAASMLAIWPLSSNLTLLATFAVLNGIANGSFFVTMPTVVARMFGPTRAAVAMSQAITGWTVGYLLGPPIAGYLIQATHAEAKVGLDPYRPAIFYAGGTAAASAVFVMVARFATERKVLKKI